MEGRSGELFEKYFNGKARNREILFEKYSNDKTRNGGIFIEKYSNGKTRNRGNLFETYFNGKTRNGEIFFEICASSNIFRADESFSRLTNERTIERTIKFYERVDVEKTFA